MLLKDVSRNGSSFHSTQATSQALQPMQVVMSISLQTSARRAARLRRARSGVAGDGLDAQCCLAHAPHSLLHFDQESLELGRVRVGIDDRRRKQLAGCQRGLAFVFGDAAIAPVNRDADLVGLLAVDHHRLDAARHHRLGDVVAARAGHLDLLAAA